MVLKIMSYGVPIPLVKISHKNDEIFISDEEENNIIKIINPFEEELSSQELDEFELYFFHNQFLSENKILEIYEKNLDKKIGWIFPINSISSKEHDFKDNRFFLKYAHIALMKLLKHKEECSEVPEIIQGKEYSIEEFFCDNTCIAIINKKEIGEDLDIINYLPSFYRYDYVYKNKGAEKERVFDSFEDDKKKISIKSISKDIILNNFAKNVFNNLIPKEANPLIKFYLLYQVIELFIEEVFNIKCKILIDNASDLDLRELKDKLIKISNEKKMINILFNNIPIENGLKNELIQECKNFLGNSETSMANHIYKVRSILFHRYREINSSQKERLKYINNLFEKLIICVLIEYNKEKIEQDLSV